MTQYQYLPRNSAFNHSGGTTLPVFAVTPSQIEKGVIDPVALAWARMAGFKAESGELLPVPASNGTLGGALLGLGSSPLDAPFLAGRLARLLPPEEWHVEIAPMNGDDLALGFALGAYRFERYKKASGDHPTLMMPNDANEDEVERIVAGVYLTRDLINTPTNDMGPAQLETAMSALAAHHNATFKTVVGDDLIASNLPLIHAVGRASAQPPRLLEMQWGQRGRPKITLVGKGVCFDTGGLNLKPGNSMALMKKDMGGAANVLGLALMIMDAGLDVDLRVLIPAVENSVSASAFRPGDVLTSRNGTTVQIDNTDAEGRLILADALTLACEDSPELLIDMATLTGAARVALGADVAPLFTNSDELADAISNAAEAVSDPVWRLPLHAGYKSDLKTSVADLTNAPAGGMAGSITAALFLEHFVTEETNWAHFDIYGWNPKDKPHAPVGGEAQAIRALYRMLSDRYA